MKLHICKSVDLSQNQEAWYTRIINGITQIVIPRAIISSNRVDVQGDKMSDCFLGEAFRVVEKIVVNEEHNSDLNVGHIENITHKWDEGLVVGDIVVENPDAIEKVKSGQYKALSIEGFGKTFKMLADGTREILTGVVNAVALTSNPANKDAFFAKSDNSDIPDAIEVKDNTDTNLSKSDTHAQADDVDTQALQVEVIKDLEKQLKEAKAKLEEATNALAKSNEQAELVKSVDAAKKKLENENYILKMSVATIKKAEDSYKNEIETLKKSLDEANAKITSLNDEIEKTPVANKINKKAEVEVTDEEVEEILVKDSSGKIKSSASIMKLLLKDYKKN